MVTSDPRHLSPTLNGQATSGRRDSLKIRFHCVVVVVVAAVCLTHGTDARSRMIEPPTRASLWRYGFSAFVNYNDDEVMCGGYTTQYEVNQGRCGICGDPWNEAQPRRYEAGSPTTPSPRPVRVYQMGDEIPVAVESSANLLGQYEFRLCKLNSSDETPDQACFDQGPVDQQPALLPIRESGLGRSYRIGQSGGLVLLHVVLPVNFTCSHCILQWRHVTGYRVKKDQCVRCSIEEPEKCTFCQGCGEQSWFQGCSDIAIYDIMGTHPAVQGVKSQEELKVKWDQTLKDIKDNCSCGPNGSKPSDNAINPTQPYSESTTSDFLSVSVSGAVTQTVPSSTSNPNLVPNSSSPPNNQQEQPTSSGTSGNSNSHKSSTDNSNANQASGPAGNTDSQPIVSGGSGHSQTTLDRPIILPGQLTPPTTQPTPVPIKHDNLGSSPPVFNPNPTPRLPQVTNRPPQKPPQPQQPQPTGIRICYVPFRPPFYLFDARGWCVRNCPRSGPSVCRYKVCQPVRCRPPRRTNSVWSTLPLLLLPFFFTEGFELY